MTQISKETISILMPAHNEGLVIHESLKRLTDFMKTQPLDYEIIVSDDGSWDNTTLEVQKAAKDFGQIHYIRNEKNKGKGLALKNAFFVSKGNIIIFLDADLDMPPAQLSLFFSTLSTKNSDVIIGSKRHPDTILDYPLKRKILSQGYAFLLRLIFGLPIGDSQTGMKLFKRNVLEKVFPAVLCKRFAHDIEILASAHRHGFSIQEVPVIIRHRRDKWGRFGIYVIFKITMDTLAIFYRMYFLKWYDQKRINH